MFEELDESGGRADRPLLEETIARVERGDLQGVVVAYLSCFGRSLAHGMSAVERITEAGGTVVSVQDGVDFSTDAGRLVLRFLLSVAEWELDLGAPRRRCAMCVGVVEALGQAFGPATIRRLRDVSLCD
jgi:DNA invertase Pin-like site-specific DNA recombinase